MKDEFLFCPLGGSGEIEEEFIYYGQPEITNGSWLILE